MSLVKLRALCPGLEFWKRRFYGGQEIVRNTFYLATKSAAQQALLPRTLLPESPGEKQSLQRRSHGRLSETPTQTQPLAR